MLVLAYPDAIDAAVSDPRLSLRRCVDPDADAEPAPEPALARRCPGNRKGVAAARSAAAADTAASNLAASAARARSASASRASVSSRRAVSTALVPSSSAILADHVANFFGVGGELSGGTIRLRRGFASYRLRARLIELRAKRGFLLGESAAHRALLRRQRLAHLCAFDPRPNAG